MSELDLKKVLELLRIDWAAFEKFIAHKTFTKVGDANIYYQSDIDLFLMTYLQENISVRPNF